MAPIATGPSISPSDLKAVEIFKERLKRVLKRLPGTGVLLETHDNSPADVPALLVEIVNDLGIPSLGLLFQPTRFDQAEAIHARFQLQKPFIRHLHLQNRNPDLSFASMKDGVVPWGGNF